MSNDSTDALRYLLAKPGGVISVNDMNSVVIDNRTWTTGTTTTANSIYYFSNDGAIWQLPKDCIVCHHPHMWVIDGTEFDHPYITDNLEYLEYKYEQSIK